MDCSKLRENIFDYLSGELDSVTRSEIADHLARCKTCRQMANELKLIDRSLKDSLAQFPIPESLPTGFTSRVYEKIRIRQRTTKRYRIYKAIAAVLLIGIVTGLVISQSIKDNPPPVQIAEAPRLNHWLENLTIPEESEAKFLLLSRLIGADDFTLFLNRAEDEFSFISVNVPSNLAEENNHWDQKLQKVIDKCFPEVQVLMCKIEKQGCKEFWVIE